MCTVHLALSFCPHYTFIAHSISHSLSLSFPISQSARSPQRLLLSIIYETATTFAFADAVFTGGAVHEFQNVLHVQWSGLALVGIFPPELGLIFPDEIVVPLPHIVGRRH